MGRGKICIPHPRDKLDLQLLEKYDDVIEVYLRGPPSIIGSARIVAYTPSRSDFRKLCKEIHDRDREVNVLLNATCFGGKEYTKNWIKKTRKYLDDLSSIGVDTLTVTDPYLLALIDHYGYSFKKVVSVLAFVLTPMRARYFDEMKVDRITLAPDVNRDLDTIKKIRKTVRCELSLIVNEGCLLHCPYRHFCYNFITHASIEEKLSRIIYDKNLLPYHWFGDGKIIKKHPHVVLTSPWIRPENLKDYEKLGINYFKISGRNKPYTFLEKCLEAYHSRDFNGNIFEIIDGAPRLPGWWKKNPTEDRPTKFYINNKDLEGFFKKVTTCDKNCPDCGFCEKFAEKHLRENEAVLESFHQLWWNLAYAWP